MILFAPGLANRFPAYGAHDHQSWRAGGLGATIGRQTIDDTAG